MKQQQLFRFTLILLMAVTAAWVIVPSTGLPAWAAGTNTVAIAPITASPGSSGSFTITLTNSDAVAAGEIRFTYDSTIGLTVTDVTAATRLNGFTISPSINTSNPSQAKVSILFYNLSGSTIAAGDGAMLTVSYTIDANATGTTALAITKALLSDSAVNSLPVTVIDGSLTVGAMATPTFTVTPTPTGSNTPTEPSTPIHTPTPTATDTPMPAPSHTPTLTPTGSNTPTHTPPSTPTDTPQPSATTPIFTVTSTATQSVTPTGTHPTATPTVAATPSFTPSATPTATATPDERDDLFAFDYELWTEPLSPAAQETAKVGIVVHRLRGKTTLQNVAVQLDITDPTGTRATLGTVTVPLLGAHTQENSGYQPWTPAMAGAYILSAKLDPADQIPESDETNNVITRTLFALPPAADRVPPRVTGFTINDGAATTGEQVVTLRTTATDPEPGSGVASLMFIEFEYLPSVNRWTPIHVSPWLDYATIRQGTTWTVTAEAGAKYLQSWAMDQALNISSHPSKAYINYQPTTQTIGQDATNFYRYQLQQGERLTARLDAASGDPDLAVWAPDYATRAPWLSQATQSPDLVTFVAPLTGLYQVEVRGHSAATYHLSVDITADGAQSELNRALVETTTGAGGAAKPQPTQPYLALDSAPDLYVPDPPSLSTPIATATPTATATATATATPTAINRTADNIYLPIVQQ